jgi:AmiR/NasT family two-component response regulator
MRRKKIFIVEDARVVALELQKMLEEMGYLVSGIAGSGEQAVSTIVAAAPELILMDVKLSGKMSGIEASMEIRKQINVPVIYTTAYSDRNIVDEIQKSFPYGFVIKPYRQNDLLVAIETAFTRFEYEKKLMESERKYKSLFDGSGDIIFTLDDGLNILTANWAVMNHLNMRPDDLVSKNFFDLLHVSPGMDPNVREFVREKTDAFLATRGSMGFKTTFRSNFNNEPVEMNVRFESIVIPGGNLIMVRAFRVVEDELLKFFHSEMQSLVLGNQLFLGGDVAYRITRNLKRYLDADTVDLVRLALVEMIINAIEHGNLEVTFEEKSRVLCDGTYSEFIARRQRDPAYNGRHVRIDFTVGPEAAVYTISDEGAGFDHDAFFKKEMSDVNTEMKPHGRGMLMSRKIFDEIRYNETGNSVTLVKRFAPVSGS